MKILSYSPKYYRVGQKKFVLRRLRYSACCRSGEITQPRTHFLANSVLQEEDLEKSYCATNSDLLKDACAEGTPFVFPRFCRISTLNSIEKCEVAASSNTTTSSAAA